MVDINPFKAIGQGFFFLKFYAFICISYVLNFMKHSIEKIIYGNSKTVICPFEKTHPDVFLTIGKCIYTQNNSFSLMVTKFKNMNFKLRMEHTSVYGELYTKLVKFLKINILF